MRKGDIQLGFPARDYADTKANIEAIDLGLLVGGETAYAIDNPSAPFGKYDGDDATWHWSSNDNSGTSGVASVSGDGVDNTDPANPVISYPTPADIGADLAGAASTAEANAKSYADGLVVGLWDDRGAYDASGGAYPSTGGSGTAGAINKGDAWTISVAGTLPTGQVVEVGDVVRALTNTPGNTQANWAITQNNIGYVAENSANKATTMTGNETSNIIYLTAKAVYDWAIGLFVQKNAGITGATKTKITYDTKGLITSGADLSSSDIPNLDTSKITSGTFAAARLPAPTTSDIGGVKRNTGNTNQFVTGIDSAGDLTYDVPMLVNKWIETTGTFTYGGTAYTINTPTDLSGSIPKGSPVRWKQGGAYKYGNVKSITSSVITILANNDYTVANSAITDFAFSLLFSPLGFPESFSFTLGWSSDSNPQPSYGNATLSMWYTVVSSGLYAYSAQAIFGSTTTFGTGLWRFSLPAGVTRSTTGNSFGIDVSVPTYATGVTIWDGTTKVLAMIGGGYALPTFPYTWANGDYLGLAGTAPF